MTIPISVRESIGESIMPPENPGQATVTTALYSITRDLAEVLAATADGRTPRALKPDGKPGSELKAADILDRLDYVRCATSQRLGIGWEPAPRPDGTRAFDWTSKAIQDNGAWNAWGRADVR